MLVDVIADVALVTLSSAYARWLAKHKNGEPDWTWIEVGFGVGYCLGHAYALGRHHGGDWRHGWGASVRSLLLGGIPVAIGEVDQWLTRREERRRLAARWGD